MNVWMCVDHVNRLAEKQRRAAMAASASINILIS